jgi:hypothetical protein
MSKIDMSSDTYTMTRKEFNELRKSHLVLGGSLAMVFSLCVSLLYQKIDESFLTSSALELADIKDANIQSQILKIVKKGTSCAALQSELVVKCEETRRIGKVLGLNFK